MGEKKKSGGLPRAAREFMAKEVNAGLTGGLIEIRQVVFKNQRQVLSLLGEYQTRIVALENVLERRGLLSRAELETEISVVEDKALGMEAVEAAQAGDYVRLVLESRAADEAEFAHPTNLYISRCAARDGEGNVQTFAPLEDALIGAKAGEIREVVLPPEEEGAKGSVVRATIIRVSRRTEKKA